MIDLDNLLEIGLEEAAKADELKDGRRRLREGIASPKEREEVKAQVRAIEAKIEWDTIGREIVFTRQSCACGEVNYSTAAIGQRLRSRKEKTATMFQASQSLERGSFQVVTIRDVSVEACVSCLESEEYEIFKGAASCNH